MWHLIKWGKGLQRMPSLRLAGMATMNFAVPCGFLVIVKYPHINYQSGANGKSQELIRCQHERIIDSVRGPKRMWGKWISYLMTAANL